MHQILLGAAYAILEEFHIVDVRIVQEAKNVAEKETERRLKDLNDLKPYCGLTSPPAAPDDPNS